MIERGKAGRWPIFQHFFARYFRERFIDNRLGLFWAFATPLATLAIYAFVFTQIFKARLPEASEVGFVAYLALAYWPWIAFAEAVQRATAAITENRELIGKVAVPLPYLPIASATATFSVHMLGYLGVIVVLLLTGTSLAASGIPALLTLLPALLLLTCALALATSALQVYFRDFAQALNPIFMLWFFSTPIIYSISLIPAEYRSLLDLNPFLHFMTRLREAWLVGSPVTAPGDWLWLGAAVVALGVSWRLFARLARRFEDYL